jgi:Right handed beta helix region
LAIGLAACGHNPQAELDRGMPLLELPAGEIHLNRPLVVPKGAHDVKVVGNPSGSTLVLEAGFQGSAAIVIDGASNVTLSGFSIVGDRSDLKSDWYLPLKEAAFADYYTANGIVVRNSANVTIRGVRISRIRAFPIIVNATSKALIDSVTIKDSGTLNREGHNNTTGGILIEEGSSGFEVRNSDLTRVTGNGIWTHSYARSPRQSDGSIHDNTVNTVARDAIQVGHATRIRVENNRGLDIGFPVEYVDFPGYATPVALDTAGNVDHSVYSGNVFSRVAGQCIDLDGFHDGEVTNNQCINEPVAAMKWIGLHFGILFGNHDPGMTSSNVTVAHNTIEGFAYGGVFLIGDHNRIEDNNFNDVSLAGCGTLPVPAKCNALPDQPDALRSGIYLSDNGGRLAQTHDNIIRNNVITRVDLHHCITAKPGVNLKANTVTGNSCIPPPIQ